MRDYYSAIVKITSSYLNYNWVVPYDNQDVRPNLGTGFIIGSDIKKGVLYILTVGHVIDNAVDFWIEFPHLGKKPHPARVLGLYLGYDIALLEMDFPDQNSITVLPLGDSDSMDLPAEVVALGYPVGSDDIKITRGIISGRDGFHLRTDTPVNPGNSGGPLIDENGKVIGIISSGLMKSQSIGFAIPINIFKRIKDQLMKTHNPRTKAKKTKMQTKTRVNSIKQPINLIYPPTLGISWAKTNHLGNSFVGIPEEFLDFGIQVTKIQRFSLTKKAGLTKGDILIKINDHSIDNWGELVSEMDGSMEKISVDEFLHTLIPGQKTTITFWSLIEQTFRTEAITVSSADHIYQIRERYPILEGNPFIIWNGLVLMDLALQHLRHDQFSHLRFLGYEDRLDIGVVLVSHLVPGSEASMDRIIGPGEMISSCNGKKVHNVKDVIKALDAGLTDVGIITSTGKTLVVPIETVKVSS